MSFDVNSVVIVGRLTRDVELSYTSNTNMAIGKFGLANNNSSKEGDGGVSFFDIITFGKVAENCNKYISKGSQVIINGRLQQSRWQDKNDGSNRSKIEIIASNVQFIGSRADTSASNFNEPQGGSIPSSNPVTKSPPPAASADPFEGADFSNPEEDIPF